MSEEEKDIFIPEFRDDIEREEQEKVTREQLDAEYALLQETRELLSRIEARVGDPRALDRFRALNVGLEWVQASIVQTMENMEE